MMWERIRALWRRPRAIVVEEYPGLYTVWFGGWVLTAGTNGARMHDLAERLNT